MIFHCPHCGLKAAPKSPDCSNCGRRMTRRCGGCSEEIAVNATACKYCGESMKAEKPAAAPAPGIQFLDEKPAKPAPSLLGMTLCFAFGTLVWGALGSIPVVAMLLAKGIPFPAIALTVATAVIAVALPIRLLIRGIRFLTGSGAPRWKTLMSTAAGAVLTLGLVFSAGSMVRTNCYLCFKADRSADVSAGKACTGKQSHCGRRICRKHKTPLWITLIEAAKNRPCCSRMMSPADAEPVSSPEKPTLY